MCLVTFEGIDGSGKSTQAVRLHRHLEDEGYAPLLVRDPGGTALSEQVRQLVLDAESSVDPMAELMLFCAARAQLVAEKIRPALEAGRVVVCDRFYDSTTAYQGGGRGVASLDWLEELHQHVTGGLVPDRTYWVDLDPRRASQRRSGGHADDRMESAGTSFQEKVAAAYARLADEHPQRILRLDGQQSVRVLQARIQADMQSVLLSTHGTALSGEG